MKPRLIKLRGVWHCGFPFCTKGLGYTPEQAYWDWLSRQGVKA